MGLEVFGFIDDLDAANPLFGDNVEEGDDHLRGIKTTLKNQFVGDVGVDEWDQPLLVGPAELNVPKARSAIWGSDFIARLGANANLGLIGSGIQIFRSGGILAMSLSSTISTVFNIQAEVDGANVQFVAKNAAGVGQVLMVLDGDIGPSFFQANGVNALTMQAGTNNQHNRRVTLVAAPTSGGDAANKTYVDDINTAIQVQISSLQQQIDDLIDATTKFSGAQEAPDFTAV
jgi:hypothetical protein